MAVRIGLAFNLKPEAPANPAGADPSSPSSSDITSARALRSDLAQPDLYAEWDEPTTIDAVEARPQHRGPGLPPRGGRELPRAARADPSRLRLQHRRGPLRPEPRGPRPRDLRVPRRPLSRVRPADPRPLARQAAGQGGPRLPRRPHRALHAGAEPGRRAEVRPPLPALREALLRGLGQGRERRRASAGTARSWCVRSPSSSPPTRSRC